MVQFLSKSADPANRGAGICIKDAQTKLKRTSCATKNQAQNDSEKHRGLFFAVRCLTAFLLGDMRFPPTPNEA